LTESGKQKGDKWYRNPWPYHLHFHHLLITVSPPGSRSRQDSRLHTKLPPSYRATKPTCGEEAEEILRSVARMPASKEAANPFPTASGTSVPRSKRILFTVERKRPQGTAPMRLREQ
jgi:hypothetical protein